MTQLKYKLATGFPVISLTSGEDVHLQFARQMQPGDWIEWPAFERDAKRMLNYLLDVGIVPLIDQRDQIYCKGAGQCDFLSRCETS